MQRYDPGVRSGKTDLRIDATLFTPGLRVAVGVSGGADSVALLRVLTERSGELGLVVHVAHLHHGMRGAEADADRDFCRQLAEKLGLTFHEWRVDTAAQAKPDAAAGKAGETVEEAARRLRYGWFRELMGSGAMDVVVTAHTRDDQAETVLGKFLRGAWTEGLSGIHPVVQFPEGRILRPLLKTSRTEVEAYLRELGQEWREDSTNRHMTYTRNRIRHELLPLLEGWNPKLREHLAQMAELALEEEAWWEGETARAAAQVVLPGRPVRGGGRAAGEGLAIEAGRLGELPMVLQRRVLRLVAGRLGAKPDFDGTEALRKLTLNGRAGQKCELAGVVGERTHRELRLSAAAGPKAEGACELTFEVPGEVEAAEWGLRLRVAVTEKRPSGAEAHIDHEADVARLKSSPITNRPPGAEASPAWRKSIGTTEVVRFQDRTGDGLAETAAFQDGIEAGQGVTIQKRRAVLRPWRAGDRVQLRYSGRARKVKEVLERMHVSGTARARWPVLEMDGVIVWMQGVQLEPEPGIQVSVQVLEGSGG